MAEFDRSYTTSYKSAIVRGYSFILNIVQIHGTLDSSTWALGAVDSVEYAWSVSWHDGVMDNLNKVFSLLGFYSFFLHASSLH